MKIAFVTSTLTSGARNGSFLFWRMSLPEKVFSANDMLDELEIRLL
jgi:hypothetical protein